MSIKHKISSWSAETPYTPEIIEGTSMTIPNQAPSMKDLLLSSVDGVPLPRVGVPTYDESDEAGLARAEVRGLNLEEVIQRKAEYDAGQKGVDEREKVPDEESAKRFDEEVTPSPEETPTT